MTKNFVELARENIKGRQIKKFEEGQNIDQFIIQQSAEVEVAKLTEALFSSMRNNLSSTLMSQLAPRFQFEHVREQDLRIWGKKDNVAFAKATLIEILRNLRSVCNRKDFEKALMISGRKSGLNFFDQFRFVLIIEDTIHLPPNVIHFLGVLSKFDARSAWWDDVEFVKEDGRISTTITRPFWRYPWLDTENHYLCSFICGYFLTLYNCCSDYIRIISECFGLHSKSTFALEAIDLPEPNLVKCFFHVKTTDEHVDSFGDIDLVIDALSEWLLADIPLPGNLEESIGAFEFLTNEIEHIFSTKLNIDEEAFNNIKRKTNQLNPNYIKSNLYSMLNEIRLQYQDLRIGKIKEIVEVK